MAQNKSTSHNFQSIHLICLLLGSLMMSISIEAEPLDTLDEIRKEFQKMKTTLHTPPSNANHESITALKNAIDRDVELTERTSTIGNHLTTERPDKFSIELDVMTIKQNITNIKAHLEKVQNLLSSGNHSLLKTVIANAESKCEKLSREVQAL